jgi:CubicO group peptidase (beta-lactamase class C family)
MLSSILRLLFAAALAGDERGPWLELADPAASGWSTAALAEARRLAEQIGSAAVFAVHRGRVVVAWGAVAQPFECHSVRKSLLSALYGRRVAEGTIDLDATIAELGIDDVPPLTESEKRARVRDLLAARSGIYHTAAKEPADMKRERPPRGSRQPDEEFFYNNWDFNVAGVILANATHHAVGAEFGERLAVPLGMEDFDPAEDAFDQLEPSSSIHPAYAFRLSARDLARVGELYRRRGNWDGEQLVPASWIDESTRPRSRFEAGRGYAFMWWTYAAGALAKEHPTLARHDAFAAIGTGGQLLLVVPGADFVFVHRADTDHGRQVKGGDVWRLAEKILAAHTGGDVEEPELQELSPEPLPGALPPMTRHRAVPIAAADLAEVAGDYAGAGLRVRVHVHEGRLFAFAGEEGEVELLAAAKDFFFVKGMNLTVAIERAADGSIRGVRLELLGRPATLTREGTGSR